MRRNVQSVMQSLTPQSLGLCAGDLPNILAYLNAATERLLIAGGETGWVGTWDKIRFRITRTDPFLVAPSFVARIINMTVCRAGIKIQNGLFELLEDGIGYQERDGACKSFACSITQAYDRQFQPFHIVPTPGTVIRFIPSNAADVGKRIMVSGLDTNNLPVNSVDNGSVVPGVFVTLDFPFVDTPLAFNEVSVVQKDLTLGTVGAYQVNADSTTTLLANYGPNEQFPNYRKYFIAGLPWNYHGNPNENCELTVEAMCKREFVPYTCEVDPLIISNLEALREEMQAIRFGQMDSPAADQKEALHHRKAIKLLQDELDHVYGRERPAIAFSPFGNRCADRHYGAIGLLT